MDTSEVFYHLGISLGLGLLVGLQRERSDSRLAGFRTFPLITILGTVSSLLSLTFGGWIVALGLATVQLVQEGKLGADTAWRVILAASMSNVVFKAATGRARKPATV